MEFLILLEASEKLDQPTKSPGKEGWASEKESSVYLELDLESSNLKAGIAER